MNLHYGFHSYDVHNTYLKHFLMICYVYIEIMHVLYTLFSSLIANKQMWCKINLKSVLWFFFLKKKSVITFHIVIDVSISSLLKFSLEVWGGRFFRSEVMLQEGFTLNGWESVCKLGLLKEATSSLGKELFYWENSEYVVWLCTGIVSKGNSFLTLMADPGFPY